MVWFGVVSPGSCLAVDHDPSPIRPHPFEPTASRHTLSKVNFSRVHLSRVHLSGINFTRLLTVMKKNLQNNSAK